MRSLLLLLLQLLLHTAPLLPARLQAVFVGQQRAAVAPHVDESSCLLFLVHTHTPSM